MYVASLTVTEPSPSTSPKTTGGAVVVGTGAVVVGTGAVVVGTGAVVVGTGAVVAGTGAVVGTVTSLFVAVYL